MVLLRAGTPGLAMWLSTLSAVVREALEVRVASWGWGNGGRDTTGRRAGVKVLGWRCAHSMGSQLGTYSDASSIAAGILAGDGIPLPERGRGRRLPLQGAHAPGQARPRFGSGHRSVCFQAPKHGAGAEPPTQAALGSCYTRMACAAGDD